MNTRLVLALLFTLTLASCATNDVEDVLGKIGQACEVAGQVGVIVGCAGDNPSPACPAVPAADQ